MDQEKIGKFIAEKRKSKKLTQEEFAEKIGVSNRTVSRWETGRCAPDLSLYQIICEELDITINELMSGENIDKGNYQEKLEENMINVVNDVKHKNNILGIITNVLLLFIAGFVLIFGLNIFSENAFIFKVEYKEENMVIEKVAENKIKFKYFNSAGLDYLILNYDNQGYIFVTLRSSLKDKINNSKALANEKDATKKLIDLKRTEETIDYSDTNLLDNFKVYYTSESMSKIRSCSDKVLEQIINKSHLLYQNE